MKRLSIVLAVILLLCSIGCAEENISDAFIFRNGIQWGMNKYEVVSLEGNNYSDYGNDLYYLDVRVSSCTASLSYIFSKDSLVMALYNISQYSKSDFMNVLSAFTTKYGTETESNLQEFYEALNMPLPSDIYVDEFYPNPIYLKWEVSDGTKILMYWIGERENIEGYGHIEGNSNFMVVYISPDYEDMDSGDVDITGV